MRFAVLVLVVAMLAGCSGPVCLQQQSYENATAMAKLKAPPGLIVPKPNFTMRIPEVKGGSVGVYPHSQDVEPPRMRCLATPRPFKPDQA